MISVSQAIRNAYNQSTTQTDKIILNGKEYKINNVEYIDDTYLDGNIFGTAIARQLSFEIEACNIEKQEFEYLTGIEVNGIIQWISLGKFITQDTQESDTSGMIKVEAMDYMLKTNIVYKSLLHYSDGTVKLYDVLQEACGLAGLTLATNSITNGDFIVDSNQFEEGTLVRQVIQAVAQISGTVAKIKRNNSLYLINPNQLTSVSKVFTTHDYHNIDIKRYTHPINTVILGMKDVEGENVTLRDETSVAQYGENKIVFNDNPFAYTEAKRTQLITALFNAIKGFEYKAYSLEGQAYPYMETLDKIQFMDIEGNTYASYIFRFNYKSPNGLESTTEAPSITDATVKYENIMGAEEIAKRTELIVDKQNQQITSVIENVGEQDKKIARVTQTVDELNSKISDIADITTSLESNSAKLEFEGINQSEPIRVVIHPIGVNIAKLHPHPNLKPKVGLKITTRILRFKNTTTNEVFNYELPGDLLYYDSEHYDEFILDYDSQTCVINKKCKWNNDGTVGLLASERTDEYEYPIIELTDGDYEVSLIKYSNGYLFVRLMAQNIYTTQFATKAEVNSEIRQTVNNINLSVNSKLSNYSTTTEMNSAIDLKANEITSSVSETYATQETLKNNYSTIDQTADMISSTVSSMTKKNIENVTVEYALGTSTTTAPTSGWSTKAPTWQQGKYMWQRTKTKTADGTEEISEPTCISGANGSNGVSISSITEYYAVSSSNTTAPAESEFKTTMQTMTETNKYLWNYEVIKYSNNSTETTIKRVIGVYGNKGTDGTNGTNGVGIKSIVNKYQVSTSNTTAPTTWKDTPQTMTPTNKYLWNYEIITYTNNSTTTSTPAVIGTYGDKGSTGTGVKDVVAEYYLSTSETTQTGGSWSTKHPKYEKDHYYWTRTKVTYTDDTVTYTAPTLVEDINSLNQSVSKLTIEAGNIKSSVEKKVDGDKIISTINQTAEAVQIEASKINLNGAITANENVKINTDGTMECNGATINGGSINLVDGDSGDSAGVFHITSENEDSQTDVNSDGFSTWTGATSSTWIYSEASLKTFEELARLIMESHFYSIYGRCYQDNAFFELNDSPEFSGQNPTNYIQMKVSKNDNYKAYILLADEDNNKTRITPAVVYTPTVVQTSLESEKKNFEKYENALETLKNIDIYKYNLKSEEDDTKKHIGFVIGDDYKYSEEVTSKNNDGVDIYSFVSLCCKAIQEQQKQIEELQKEIKELKGGKE